MSDFKCLICKSPDGSCVCPTVVEYGEMKTTHLSDAMSRVMGSLAGLKIQTYNANSVKGRIFELFNKQTEKGLQKYGHTLDDCPDEKFDWRLMIIEELVDCIQYQQKEIQRLERLLNP